MVGTVIVLALLVLLGVLGYLIIAGFRDSVKGGLRSIAAIALPLLVLALLRLFNSTALVPAMNYIERVPVAILVVIAALAGFGAAALTERTKPANPVAELFCASLLVWVIAARNALPHGNSTFIYSLGGLIGAAVYLMMFVKWPGARDTDASGAGANQATPAQPPAAQPAPSQPTPQATGSDAGGPSA